MINNESEDEMHLFWSMCYELSIKLYEFFFITLEGSTRSNSHFLHETFLYLV